MSRIRLAATAAMIACGLMLVGGTGIASAQDGPARLTQVVPISGKSTKGNKQLQRHVHDRALRRQGQQALLGRHRHRQARLQEGHQGERPGSRDGRERQTPAAGQAQASQVPPLPLPPLPAGNACSILSLDLGPINLNLLGLVVRTNQIQLRIDAVQGPGNLLGNLLCGITGILNPSGALANTPLGQLAADPQRAARALAAHRLTDRSHVAAGLEPAAPRRSPRSEYPEPPAWSSSPASSPPGASTSATTSGRSSSTWRARTAPIRRSTASSTCTARRSPTTRRSCASARATRRRCSSPPGWTPSAASSSARATCPSTPS